MSDPLDPAAPIEESGAPEPDAGGDESGSPKGQNDAVQAVMRKLRKAEKALADRQAADELSAQSKLSEVDKLKTEFQKLEAERNSLSEKLKTQALRHSFESIALKAGVVDADAAFKLADLSAVEIDEDGKVTGLEAAMADLKKTRKFLFGSLSQPVGSAGGNPPAGPPSTRVTEAQLQSMTSDEFRAWSRAQQSR